ncbi:MAG: DUF2059 domain-containing protein [Bacteroidota bacterium]
MKKILLLLLICGTFATAQAQDAALNAKVEQLLEVTGAKQQFLAAVGQIIDMQRENPQFASKFGQDFWDEFQTEMEKEAYNDLKPKMVELYAKTYTEAEIDHQLTFYGSELGQQIVAKQAGMMQESMQIGQRWGMALGQKIAEKLQEAGN